MGRIKLATGGSSLEVQFVLRNVYFLPLQFEPHGDRDLERKKKEIYYVIREKALSFYMRFHLWS